METMETRFVINKDSIVLPAEIFNKKCCVFFMSKRISQPLKLCDCNVVIPSNIVLDYDI